MSLFERLMERRSMIEAEQELARQGKEALPILESLFTGDAKNQFGVPYRKLGLPLQCALEIVRQLGRVAKPLEKYVREELRAGNYTAAMALGSLGSLDELSVRALAQALEGDPNVSHEAAAALIRCGEANHAVVCAIVKNSQRASAVLDRVSKYLAGR